MTSRTFFWQSASLGFFVFRSIRRFVLDQFVETRAEANALVIVHLHYSWPSFWMKKLLEQHPAERIVVTSNNSNILAKAVKLGCVAKAVPNRGRNFAGILSLDPKDLANLDFVIHLHYKRSKHSRLLGAMWNFILWTHLSSPQVLKSLDGFSKNSQFIFFPDLEKIFSQTSQNWGMSGALLSHLQELDRKALQSVEIFKFPMGGMFASSPSLVIYLKEILTRNGVQFSDEPIRSDGEWPHFCERALGALASIHGFEVVTDLPKVAPGR